MIAIENETSPSTSSSPSSVELSLNTNNFCSTVITDPTQNKSWRWYGPSKVFFGKDLDYVDYNKLPNICILDKYININSINDLRQRPDIIKNILKPPGCRYFLDFGEVGEFICYDADFDPNDDPYYYWTIDPNTQYIYDTTRSKKENIVYVAKSLPEFLSRLDIDGKIWWNVHYSDKKENLTDYEKKYFEDIVSTTQYSKQKYRRISDKNIDA